MAKNKSEFEETQEEDVGAQFENAEDGLVVDLSNVEAQKFEVLPKGTYDGIIEDVEYQISKASNKPMWNMKIAITSPEEFSNRKLFTFMSFSEKALPGTKANLEAIKPELVSGPFNPKSPDIIGQLIGTNVRMKVKIDKYNDEERNTIQKFLVHSGGGDGFIEG